MLKIRAAKPLDVTEICHIQRETWMATYASEDFGVSIRDLAEYTKNWETPENYRLFRRLLQVPDQKWLVAEVDDAVVGHIRILLKNGHSEIDMIYVLPEYQGNNIGEKLLETAVKDINEEIIVDVIEYNQRAISFYEKYGFKFLRKEKNNASPLPSGKTLGLVRLLRPALSEP